MASTEISGNPSETLLDKVSESQGTVFIASRKLQSFGELLERQGEDCEGYTELHGLGVVLRELGDDLFQVWRDLDPANLNKLLAGSGERSLRRRRKSVKRDRED